MDAADINYAARSIADALSVQAKNGHLARVDLDCIRCAIAGYLAGNACYPSPEQIEEFELVTLRKFVERCS